MPTKFKYGTDWHCIDCGTTVAQKRAMGRCQKCSQHYYAPRLPRVSGMCAFCERLFTGTALRKFCSTRCREKWHHRKVAHANKNRKAKLRKAASGNPKNQSNGPYYWTVLPFEYCELSTEAVNEIHQLRSKDSDLIGTQLIGPIT